MNRFIPAFSRHLIQPRLEVAAASMRIISAERDQLILEIHENKKSVAAVKWNLNRGEYTTVEQQMAAEAFLESLQAEIQNQENLKRCHEHQLQHWKHYHDLMSTFTALHSAN